MGNIWVKDFTGGLDARRLPEATTGGVLIKAVNGHITSGGEFEKAAAFVPVYNLPAGTKGLSNTRAGLYVFGSDPAPTMPTGVSYQQLQHSDGVTPLDRILSVELNAGKLYVVAQFTDGAVFHFYDGTRVTDWFDGRARASFTVTGGVSSDTLTHIRVNGVQILGGTITWATSNEATAAAIAASINGATTSPDYSATAVGNRVNIIAATAGASSNGLAVSFVTTGTFGITPTTGLAMANGADGSTFQPGSAVKTVGSKMYSVSGPNLHFSGIKAPTKWTTETTGAGFIDLSSVATGLEDLKAIAKYGEYLAIFAENTVQVHYVESNPDNSRPVQTLENTGTRYPNSVSKFGDNDLFYADSGVRSLKARDSSNAASTTDIGVPIDALVRAALEALSSEEAFSVIGAIEPREKRFWLIVGNLIFVFSYFAGARVSAWSTYEPGFNIEALTIFDKKAFVRSGDVIYAYGGLGTVPEYDATVAEAWLPYLDAGDPTRTKAWVGIDAAVTGRWVVACGTDPLNIDTEDIGPVMSETTYGKDRVPLEAASTHLSVRLRSSGTGAAKVASVVLHFEGDADAD